MLALEREAITQEKEKFYKYVLIRFWIFVIVGGALLLKKIRATRKQQCFFGIFLFG